MSDTGLISIQLGLATAWMHEERDTHGRWTHGAGLPTAPRSEERRGYHGHYEGYDPLVPSMAPADARKNLSLPGRPDGAGTPDDPIDVQGNMTRAVQLMAIGKHVRLNGPREIGPLLDEVDRQATAMGYNRAKEPTWDLGNISVKGTRLFNEQTLGIPRNQMPQLSGNAPPGTEAAILAGGANRFIILDPQFRAQLERDGVDVKNERVPAGNLRATQTQLTAATVAGITKAAEGGNKAVLKMLREPIWVTSDNYVLDGHHRWASDEALAFTGHGPKDIEVHRIGLPARLAVPYANAFAAQMGIGPTGLGNAKLVNTANLLYPHVIELKFNPEELRNPHGEWTRGAPPHEDVASWDEDWQNERKIDAIALPRDRISYGTGDLALAEITHQQGFDGPPTKGDIAATVAAGGKEMWRGVSSGFGKSYAQKYADDWNNGTENHQSPGLFGDGTYFATGSTGQKLAGEYERGKGVMMHAALKPSARIIEWNDLKVQWQAAMRAHKNHLEGNAMMDDPGRYAAMLGYDAIATIAGSGTTTTDTYVILNRTQVVVPG